MGFAKEKNGFIDRDVIVGSAMLPGYVTIPENAQGVVIFAHGSGSSRFSARNRKVAKTLNEHHIGTLLLDLLMEEEEASRQNVFDIELLADRLEGATEWLKTDMPEARDLPIGYFGASTGAAAALVAAANDPDRIHAVVSRGGRPDLARRSLALVKAPTLLIVGGADEYVVELNKKAINQMRCIRSLEIVPDATHLFPEPGALDMVAGLAGDWFLKYF